MASNQKQSREDKLLRRLEEELRCLPKVEVPGTLEARLLGAIPRMPAEVTWWHQLRWRRWAAAMGAAVAAIALIIAALILRPPRSIESFRKPTGVLIDTSPRYVLGDQVSTLSEETKPCDVLPPLPELH